MAILQPNTPTSFSQTVRQAFERVGRKTELAAMSGVDKVAKKFGKEIFGVDALAVTQAFVNIDEDIAQKVLQEYGAMGYLLNLQAMEEVEAIRSRWLEENPWMEVEEFPFNEEYAFEAIVLNDQIQNFDSPKISQKIKEDREKRVERMRISGELEKDKEHQIHTKHGVYGLEFIQNMNSVFSQEKARILGNEAPEELKDIAARPLMAGGKRADILWPDSPHMARYALVATIPNAGLAQQLAGSDEEYLNVMKVAHPEYHQYMQDDVQRVIEANLEHNRKTKEWKESLYAAHPELEGVELDQPSNFSSPRKFGPRGKIIDDGLNF